MAEQVLDKLLPKYVYMSCQENYRNVCAFRINTIRFGFNYLIC